MPVVLTGRSPHPGCLESGEQRGGAIALVVVGRLLRQAWSQRQDRRGPVQGLDLDFSSTHSTTAFSGGFRYSPTTSRTLASSSGSVENLNVSYRQVLDPAFAPGTGDGGIPDPQVPSNREDHAHLEFGRWRLERGGDDHGIIDAFPVGPERLVLEASEPASTANRSRHRSQSDARPRHAAPSPRRPSPPRQPRSAHAAHVPPAMAATVSTRGQGRTVLFADLQHR